MATLKAMLTQLKTALLAQNWSGGSNRVFGTGSVEITRYIPQAALRTARVPGAMLMPADDRSDPEFDEEPDLVRTRVIVRLFVNVPGDALGSNPIMGANRPDTTKSEGAGLLDLMEIVHTAIGRLNEADSTNFKIQFRRTGGAGGIHIDENVRWEYQDLEFEAWTTAA